MEKLVTCKNLWEFESYNTLQEELGSFIEMLQGLLAGVPDGDVAYIYCDIERGSYDESDRLDFCVYAEHEETDREFADRLDKDNAARALKEAKRLQAEETRVADAMATEIETLIALMKKYKIIPTEPPKQ